jgi:hypothetical protein
LPGGAGPLPINFLIVHVRQHLTEDELNRLIDLDTTRRRPLKKPSRFISSPGPIRKRKGSFWRRG